jgi:hypothetical protein
VVTVDTLKNLKQGSSPKDQEWFRKDVAKEYPGICYAPPSDAIRFVFYVTVSPATYHGTSIVRSQSRTDNPVSGTITNEDGSTSQVNGTVQSTSTTSTAVPYSKDYGIYTLDLDRRMVDGKYEVAQRFRQKGLYSTMYGIPLGGKGHHPVHAVIEEATKWISAGGLSNPLLGAVSPPQP